MGRRIARDDGYRHGFIRKTHIRCPDCEYREDLDAVGRVRRWHRVRRCQECGGRGEIPVNGLESIDGYALKPSDPVWAAKRARLAKS